MSRASSRRTRRSPDIVGTLRARTARSGLRRLPRRGDSLGLADVPHSRGEGMLSTMRRRALPYARAVRRRALRYARAAGLPGTLTPHDVFQDGSEKDRRAFYAAAIARNREGYEARVALMKELNEAPPSADGLRVPEIPHDKGCLLYRPDNLPVLDEALAEARELFKGYVPGTGNSKRER